MKKQDLIQLIKECHSELLTELMYTPSDKDEYTSTMEEMDALIAKIRNNKLVQASAGTKQAALKLATSFNELDIKVKDEIAKQQ